MNIRLLYVIVCHSVLAGWFVQVVVVIVEFLQLNFCVIIIAVKYVIVIYLIIVSHSWCKYM